MVLGKFTSACALALAIGGSAVAADASGRAGAPDFQVIDGLPHAEFTSVVEDASGAAYFFDQSENIIRLTPPQHPGAPWTPTPIYHYPTSDFVWDLIFGANGDLYGPAQFGGKAGCGDVYQLAPPAGGNGAWTYTEVYAFPCIGANHSLYQDLVVDPSGTIYGSGGYFDPQNNNANHEFLFKLTPPQRMGEAWTETTLYDAVGEVLTGLSGMARDASNNLYFVDIASLSAPTNIAKLTPPTGGSGPWTRTVLYSSTSFYPASNLVIGPGGVVYGNDAGRACGKAFALVPQSGGTYAYHVIHTFACSGPGGANPRHLIADAAGHLFGVATKGGDGNAGVLFELSQAGGSWTETTLHIFTRGAGGALPDFLSFGPNGALYGSTLFGGVQPPLGGTVFRYGP